MRTAAKRVLSGESSIVLRKKLPWKEGRRKVLPYFPYITDEVDRHMTVCHVNQLNLQKQWATLKTISAFFLLCSFSWRDHFFFWKTHGQEIVAALVASIYISFFWKTWCWLFGWSSSCTPGSHGFQILLLLLTSRGTTSNAWLQWNKHGKIQKYSHQQFPSSPNSCLRHSADLETYP